jgi:hypothetical protein
MPVIRSQSIRNGSQLLLIQHSMVRFLDRRQDGEQFAFPFRIAIQYPKGGLDRRVFSFSSIGLRPHYRSLGRLPLKCYLSHISPGSNSNADKEKPSLPGRNRY